MGVKILLHWIVIKMGSFCRNLKLLDWRLIHDDLFHETSATQLPITNVFMYGEVVLPC